MSTVALGLSGGGFRAAFFELGALAWIAENRKLMDVAAVSAVSGGSILAALYHLNAKALLERKADADIRHEDYPFRGSVVSLLTRDVHIWVLLAVIVGRVLYLRMRWVRKLVGGIPLMRQISWDWLVGIARMLAAVLSWVFVGFSLIVLNPLFLRAGKLDRR